MTTDELDELLKDRFDLARADLIAALKTLPAQRRWAATLTEGEAELLDSAGFAEDPQAYAEIAADVIEHMGGSGQNHGCHKRRHRRMAGGPTTVGAGRWRW